MSEDEEIGSAPPDLALAIVSRLATQSLGPGPRTRQPVATMAGRWLPGVVPAMPSVSTASERIDITAGPGASLRPAIARKEP
jgi:hypothetical protein